MLVSRSIVSTLRSPIAVNGIIKRNVVCTPPRNRVPLAEKLVHGVFIAVGIMAIPIYILTNVKHYKGRSNE